MTNRCGGIGPAVYPPVTVAWFVGRRFGTVRRIGKLTSELGVS